MRLTASVLRTAFDDLAAVLDARFLGTGGIVERILAAYAADHGGRAQPQGEECP
ncbi:hypothetical protein OG453_38445 [Streptomyces sp. NBC_01381]|uniref:hypothetical protein n=1 Tax=Streptomyces sp. NBC_01381 TaxID=2903845 RepID=UPI002251C141|nr:hypothetical protein [Streptomyces sp. NBC_01381]MCX4672468.1 hypothetical protein [Streptomyces sp. NBC_01381]